LPGDGLARCLRGDVVAPLLEYKKIANLSRIRQLPDWSRVLYACAAAELIYPCLPPFFDEKASAVRAAIDVTWADAAAHVDSQRPELEASLLGMYPDEDADDPFSMAVSQNVVGSILFARRALANRGVEEALDAGAQVHELADFAAGGEYEQRSRSPLVQQGLSALNRVLEDLEAGETSYIRERSRDLGVSLSSNIVAARR